MSLIHTTCISASVNLWPSILSVRGNLGLFPCFHVIYLLHLWWDTGSDDEHCKTRLFLLDPTAFSSSYFPFPQATDYCIQNLMSPSNSWKGDSCHAPMARCVHMAASASCICNQMGCSKLRTVVFYDVLFAWSLAEDKLSVTFLRVWGKVSEDLLQGVTEGHHDTVIQVCDTEYFSVTISLVVLVDWDASTTDGSGVFHCS